MLKKILLIVALLLSFNSFAEDQWFVGGSAGVDININPTNANVGANFDFGYQWKEWDVFGEVGVGSGGVRFKAGGDYLLRLSKKDFMNFGVLAGVTNNFENFTVGGQVGYNYYIMPDLTIGGGGRVEAILGNRDAGVGVMNISGLFTVAYYIP